MFIYIFRPNNASMFIYILRPNNAIGSFTFSGLIITQLCLLTFSGLSNVLFSLIFLGFEHEHSKQYTMFVKKLTISGHNKTHDVR